MGIDIYTIGLMDARKLNAMADSVAKQLVAASQLLVQEVRFWSHGATVSVIVEGWKYMPGAQTARRHTLIYT